MHLSRERHGSLFIAAGPFPATVNEVTGRGVASIRRAGDGVLPNGEYAVDLDYDSQVLDSARPRLACPA
jgi:hypothetical protein